MSAELKSIQSKLDPSTLSNFDKVNHKFYDIKLYIDFENKVFDGYTQIEFEILDKSEKRIVLDSKKLNIKSIHKLEENKENVALKYEIVTDHSAVESLGTPIVIEIPEDHKEDLIRVQIDYTTTPSSDGILWIEKHQTLTQKHPFVFTQGEAILGRTIFPCQDTPSSKTFFRSVSLIAEKGITALFGGQSVSSNEIIHLGKDCTEFKYTQKVNIPTYLFSVAAGELVYKRISERCGIFAEIPLLESAAEEYSGTEDFIKIAETYLDYPYIWGDYNILILPQAFPFGGMENPNLTYINPALIVGDKSMVCTVAHEIAHSWTGNLVTNKDWSNFWMNEGFTVFLERKIIQNYYDAEYANLEADVGYNELLYAINAQGETHKYTCLNSQINDEDPDDAFSVVPYEKGCNLLMYLEKLIGEDLFRDILRVYIKKFAYKSISFIDYKELFETELKAAGKSELLEKIDWDSWVNKPGHLVHKLDYSTKLSQSANDLYEKFINNQVNPENLNAISEEYHKFIANVKLVFLNLVLNNVDKLSQETYNLISQATDLNNVINHPEVSYTWFQISLEMKDSTSVESCKKFLLKQGRMKYVRPLLRAFYKYNKNECLDFFNSNKGIWHAVPVRIIQNDFQRIEEAI